MMTFLKISVLLVVLATAMVLMTALENHKEQKATHSKVSPTNIETQNTKE